MSFFKKKTDEKSLKEGGGNSKYINKSGVFDVTIIAPFVSQGNKDASVIDLCLEHEGQTQALYGHMSYTNKDGGDNEIGQKIFNLLVVVSGVDEINDPIEGTLPIGKKGADKDAAILEDLADIECKIRVQMEYSVYNGDIKEKTIIKSFYRADGASAEEIVNETDIGVQLEKDMAYAENITYKDGLDAEQIAAWITAKRPKGTANAGAAAANAATKPSFGKKKFGK